MSINYEWFKQQYTRLDGLFDAGDGEDDEPSPLCDYVYQLYCLICRIYGKDDELPEVDESQVDAVVAKSDEEHLAMIIDFFEGFCTLLEKPEEAGVDVSSTNPLWHFCKWRNIIDFLSMLPEECTNNLLHILVSLPTSSWLGKSTQMDDYSCITALANLCAHKKGHKLLDMLMQIEPKFLVNLGSEAWSTVAEQGKQKNMSALWWLCASQSGRHFLRQYWHTFYSEVVWEVLLYEPPEWDARGRPSANFANTSALYFLCVYSDGHDFLCKNMHFFAKQFPFFELFVHDVVKLQPFINQLSKTASGISVLSAWLASMNNKLCDWFEANQPDAQNALLCRLLQLFHLSWKIVKIKCLLFIIRESNLKSYEQARSKQYSAVFRDAQGALCNFKMSITDAIRVSEWAASTVARNTMSTLLSDPSFVKVLLSDGMRLGGMISNQAQRYAAKSPSLFDSGTKEGSRVNFASRFFAAVLPMASGASLASETSSQMNMGPPT